jgi:formate hydrogenlyase subunit 3/multisubunit Na+/H+ antiporter MnhD subunit
MEATTWWIQSIVLTILAWLIIIIFWWAIYAFFLAIWLFIFSWGNEEKIKKARTSLRFMILWIIMTLAFLFIFPALFKMMKIPWYQAYTAENIFKQASYIISSLLDFGKLSVEIYQWWADTLSEPSRPSPTPTQPTPRLEL